MNFESKSLSRRTTRLQGYDYSQAGAYFVTICTQMRESFFDLPAVRQIAEHCWVDIPNHFPNVELDEWVIMPNHFHGIVLITDQTSVSNRRNENLFSKISPLKSTLSVIVRTYKAAVTTSCRRAGEIEFAWQRNYHDHIIRDEADLNRIREYILLNPSHWEQDVENPKRISRRGVQLNAPTKHARNNRD
jgi:putative transposase